MSVYGDGFSAYEKILENQLFRLERRRRQPLKIRHTKKSSRKTKMKMGVVSARGKNDDNDNDDDVSVTKRLSFVSLGRTHHDDFFSALLLLPLYFLCVAVMFFFPLFDIIFCLFKLFSSSFRVCLNNVTQPEYNIVCCESQMHPTHSMAKSMRGKKTRLNFFF